MKIKRFWPIQWSVKKVKKRQRVKWYVRLWDSRNVVKRAKGQSGEMISVKISVQERNDGGLEGWVCSAGTRRVLLVALDFTTAAVSTRLEEGKGPSYCESLLLINVLSCWRGWFTKQYIFFSAILEMGWKTLCSKWMEENCNNIKMK